LSAVISPWKRQKDKDMDNEKIPFAGSEIVEIAIQIEKNGMDFYHTAAEKSHNTKAREIFNYLASEEEKHIQDFKKVLNSVQQYEPVESYPQEYFSYMNALAQGYVFTKKDKGAEIAKKAPTDIETIDFGVKAEKDSIVFYEGMKRIVPEHDIELIDSLVQQEKDHLAKLCNLKAAIYSTKE